MTAPSFTSLPAAGLRNPFWLLPGGAAIGCLLFPFLDDGPAVQQAFIGAMWGAFGAVPLVIVSVFVMIGLHDRRAKALWRVQGLDWYRGHFPAHALADGGISCRFCGGDRAQPRNLNGRGDRRAWVCGQCGHTLYFSSERD